MHASPLWPWAAVVPVRRDWCLFYVTVREMMLHKTPCGNLSVWFHRSYHRETKCQNWWKAFKNIWGSTLHYHANPLSVNILHPVAGLLWKKHFYSCGKCAHLSAAFLLWYCFCYLYIPLNYKILHYVKGQYVSFVYKYTHINAHQHILTAKPAKNIRNTRQESTVLQPWNQMDNVVPQGRGMEYHLLNGHSPFFVGSDME